MVKWQQSFSELVLGVLVIDFANERGNTRERKEELILQMGSPNNDFAVEAVRILRLKGWLKDGSLEYASLIGANLQGAKIAHACHQQRYSSLIFKQSSCASSNFS